LLCECKTWSLRAREEYILRFLKAGCCGEYFELRGKMQVTAGWRKVNKEELHNLYSSPNIRVTDQGGSDEWDMWHG
jgi:hypothetical protein